MRARWLAAVAACAAAAVLLWPAPAVAAVPAPALVVSAVHTSPGRVSFLLTPTNLPPDSTVDISGLAVRVGDTVLPVDTVTQVQQHGGAPTRVLTVVLDGGERDVPASTYFAGAQAAAAAVASAVPADVALSLFVNGPEGSAEVVPPTLDRDAYTAAVAAAQPGGTWDPVDVLNDARIASVSVQPAVERRLLLISDGANAFASDFHSTVGASVAASGIGLDIVAVRASGTGLTGLRRMAEAAGGRLLTATDAASTLSAAQLSAGMFAPTWAVRAAVPGSLSGLTSVVTVELPGFATATSTMAFAVWDEARYPAAGSLSWVPDWLLYVVALCLFASIAVGILAVAWPRSDSHALIKQLVYFGPRRTAPGKASGPEMPAPLVGRLGSSLLAACASLLRVSRLEERIEQQLERAGMKVRPHEWAALCAGVALGCALLATLLIGPLGLLLGTAFGVLASVAYVSHRTSRRAQAFVEQLPDGLQLVIGSLRSGFSLSQALDSLVRESPEPLAAEFGRAIAEHRLGADLSDALERLAQRVRSEDLAWAVMAVRIQRDVGGNLADVLQTSVDTMRERERLRRHVRALSAEGRLSGWVLVIVPIFIGAFMAVYRRSYLAPLFTDPRGLAMLFMGTVLFAVGIFWLTRVIKVQP